MYERPQTIREWRDDEPGQELYLVAILSDQTVLSACGRYAQGSGSTSVTWQQFLDGKMQDLVSETMGEEVLNEVLRELRELARDEK